MRAWSGAADPTSNSFQPNAAVFRPGVDDATVSEVNRRGGFGPRVVAGNRLSLPATPGQALRIEHLARSNQALRQRIEELNPNYARSFVSTRDPQTPQQAIRSLEVQRDVYTRDLQQLTAGNRVDLYPRGIPGLRTPGVSTDLQTAARRIDSLSRQPGNSTVNGRYSYGDTLALAGRFVGQGFTTSRRPGEPIIMRSADGLREVRLPQYKSGVHPQSLQPYSSTGYVANFLTFNAPVGTARRGGPFSNVHIDVVPTE
ncbi:MAG: hypothetical protein H6730_22995 [Deltaproteobacteria bacterium]|nr:hypothetical protein [Deltaproteobacteria bacterium]